MKNSFILICLLFFLATSAQHKIKSVFEDSVISVLSDKSLNDRNNSITRALSHPNSSDSLKFRIYKFRFELEESNSNFELAVKALVDQGIILEHLGAPSELVLEKFNEALNYAIAHNDSTNIVWSAIRISKHYLSIGELNSPEELEITNFVIENLDRNIDLQVAVLGYNHLANRHLRFYDFKTALGYYRHSYDMALVSRFPLNAMEIGGNILNLKNQYQDTTSIFSFIDEVVSINGEGKNLYLAEFYLNLAEFENLFDLEQREIYLSLALNNLKGYTNNTLENQVLFISCKLLVEESNPDELRIKLDAFKRQLSETPPTQKFYYPSQIESLEGQYYQLVGNKKIAIQHFNKSLNEAVKINAPVLFAPIYKQLYLTYYSIEKYKEAFFYLDAYNKQVDKVFSLNKVGEIESLIIQYETKKKQQTITALKNEKELNSQIALEKAKTNKILQVFVITLSALSLILIYLYILNRLKSKKLSHLNHLKDTVFSVLSHDLRSPLNTFKSLLTISSRKELSSDDYKKYLDVIKYEVGNTSDFLENILQWAQNNQDALPLKFETVELHSVLKEIESLALSNFQAKAIKFSIDCDEKPTVQTDKELISFILRNLIFNAFKFSPSTSHVSVNVQIHKNKTEVSIKDSGPGMNVLQIEDFYNGSLKAGLDSTGEKSTGIGLLLCKDFAKKIGAELSVTSKQNSGSTFCVSIPHKKGG